MRVCVCIRVREIGLSACVCACVSIRVGEIGFSVCVSDWLKYFI